MLRVLALMMSMLVAGPLLAGPGLMCLCADTVVTSCCCPHEDHGPNTLEAGCCCKIEQGAQHSPTEADGVHEHSQSPAPMMAPRVASPLKVLRPLALPSSPLAINTGPPQSTLLLQSVRLRP